MRSVYSFHSAMVFACDSAPCVFGCQLCNFPYLSRCGGSGYCRNHDFAFQMESVDRPGYKAPRRSRSFGRMHMASPSATTRCTQSSRLDRKRGCMSRPLRTK